MKQAQTTRLYFMPSSGDAKGLFRKEEVKFDFFGGFAISQKHKTITSMHKNIHKLDRNLRVLEVSTKSLDPLGIQLSAFNLKYDDGDRNYCVENIYQSSKVFKNSEQYKDLLYCSPADAKRDERLKTSGDIIGFNWNNEFWETEPKTIFYDWVYLKALEQNRGLHADISRYNAFTDIEFNPKKSINCQARSVAIFVSLYQQDRLEQALRSAAAFKKIYSEGSRDYKIISEQAQKIRQCKPIQKSLPLE
ncbi:MAG: hypothetical protein LBP89_00385 [Helicobacteraceae bacterium]|nr:hypothetical protein [Helicobacteraceae bacterium]